MEYHKDRKEWTHKGKRIVQDASGYYRVYGFKPWGDQPGEDFHRCRTILRARQLIEELLAEGKE